ncbi:zinc finger protein 431-like [Hetaerina americana]|uniref:zinc finger protein 431-like n=1 Tax=Hetaerina americana TaxID=62018 RepID=UPI003A7F3386
MEKLTEFRLFKRRCAECLAVFYNRIQKGCNPTTEDCITNREEFPGQMNEEFGEVKITSDPINSRIVEVRDDITIVKEEIDTASEDSAANEDVNVAVIESMNGGETLLSEYEKTGNLNCSEYVEIHFSSDEEVGSKKDAGILQEEARLGGKMSHFQDDGQGLVKAGNLLHTCQSCSKAFTAKDLLKAHMMRVHPKEEGQLRCDVCLEGFECKSDIQAHLEFVHGVKKSYDCKCCSKHFKNLRELRNHMATDCDKGFFNCASSSKGFAQIDDLKNPMLMHTGKSPLKCPICSKEFTNNRNLKRHKLVHIVEKPKKCEICSKGFIRNNQLRRHMLTHTGERPKKCEVCSKTFAENGHLRRHMLTHTGERPHKCEVCSKVFAQNIDLNRHMLTHTGEKPFKCHACSKAFTRNVFLKKHLLTHTDEKAMKT